MNEDRFSDWIGRVRSSPWHVIDQARINAFADATDDHQYIHVDPERAAATPFGGPIAHGFLTLSMLSAMAYQLQPAFAVTAVVNYGFDRIRFIAPVPSGARIRGHFTVQSIVARGPGQSLLTQDIEVEIEGGDKPALSARQLALIIA